MIFILTNTMTMFGVSNNNEGGKYIRACQAEEVTFLSVKVATINDKNTIEFVMCVKGAEEDKNEQKFNLWFVSEANAKMSNEQIKAWLNRTCSQEYLDANIVGKEFADIDAYANALSKALVGKSIRILFGGREYINKENAVSVSPKLITYDSSESIMPGCVKPVVLKEDSKLVINKGDKYHYEALALAPVSTDTMVTDNGDEVDDDLPF